MLIYENTTQRLREEAGEVFSGGYSKFWMAPLCINAKDRSLQWIMVRTSHSIHCSFALPCRCEIMQISWHTKCFKFQCFQCTVADFTFFFFLIGVCIPLFLHKHNMANNNKYHYYSQLNFYGCIGFTGWSFVTDSDGALWKAALWPTKAIWCWHHTHLSSAGAIRCAWNPTSLHAAMHFAEQWKRASTTPL